MSHRSQTESEASSRDGSEASSSPDDDASSPATSFASSDGGSSTEAESADFSRPSPRVPSSAVAAFRHDTQQNLQSLQLEIEQLQQMLMPELSAATTPNRSMRATQAPAESARRAYPSPRPHSAYHSDSVAHLHAYPFRPSRPDASASDLSTSDTAEASVLRSVRRMEQARQQRRTHAAAAAAIDDAVDWLDEQPDISLGPAPRRYPSPSPRVLPARSVTPPLHFARRARRRSTPPPPPAPTVEPIAHGIQRPVPLFLSRSMPPSTRSDFSAAQPSKKPDRLVAARAPAAAAGAAAIPSPANASWRRLYSAAQQNGWSLHKSQPRSQSTSTDGGASTAVPDVLKRSWPFLTRRPARISYEQAVRQQSHSSAQPRCSAATTAATATSLGEATAATSLSEWTSAAAARSGRGAEPFSPPHRAGGVPASAAELFRAKLDALAATMAEAKTPSSKRASGSIREAIQLAEAEADREPEPVAPRRSPAQALVRAPAPSPLPLRSPHSSIAPSSPLSVESLVSPLSAESPDPPPRTLSPRHRQPSRSAPAPALALAPAPAPLPYRTSSLAFTPPDLPAASRDAGLECSLHVSRAAPDELESGSSPRRALVVSYSGGTGAGARLAARGHDTGREHGAHRGDLTFTQSYDSDGDDNWSLASESPRHLSFAAPTVSARIGRSPSARIDQPSPYPSPSRSFAFDARASFASAAASASLSFQLPPSPMRAHEQSQLDVETSRVEDRLRQYQLLLPARGSARRSPD